MTFYYTARGAYDKDHYNKFGDEFTWEQYIQWSGLTQVTEEIISLDIILNEDLVEPYTYSDEEGYEVIDGDAMTHLFTSLDYVLRNTAPAAKFNLLAVVVNPAQDCKDVQLNDFEFVGYDLLDSEYGNSVLTNTRGFEEIFLPSELNQFGILDDYEKAYDIRRRLLENNPAKHHADTNVIAVWRHTTIGRIK